LPPALERTKFVFGWGFAPDPAGGAYSAPTDLVAGLRGPTSKGERMGGRRGKEGNGKEEKRKGGTALPLRKFLGPPVRVSV